MFWRTLLDKHNLELIKCVGNCLLGIAAFYLIF